MTDDLNNTHPGLIAWIRNGDRSLSSEVIVDRLARHPIALASQASRHPYDPSDLRRCILLLDAVPTLRPLLPHMAEVSAEWAAIIARWDELETSLRREMASGYYAPDTYALMKSVLEGTTP